MQRRLVVALTCAGACSGPPEPTAVVVPDVVPGVVAQGVPRDARSATSPTLPVPGVHLPDGATPRSYDLRLDLDAERETFSGSVAIHITLDRASDRVWLHADELAIQDAHWEDGPLEVVTVPGADRMIALAFGKRVEPRAMTLTLAFTGTMHHDEEGLFRQKDGDHWYLYSQGESEFARRITPCFDEPRWKTPWRVTVVAPTNQVVAGNMPIASERKTSDGRREVVLAETPPLPTYLLAIAVGPFVVVDAGRVGKDRVPLRVLTFPRRVKAVGPVARQTGKLVALLEDYTAIPLPFPKLDIVTVPHLFGAMENPGLITFDADIVFDGDRRYAVIAAHELAHQWFGNLVTPVWWDDLWLSEAFASWLGEKVAAKNEGHLPSELHVAFTRESALAADGDVGAQALHRAVTFDPDNAFDSIEYDKGEAVLATFETWLGDDVFRTALRGYLHDHAGGSVTSADLVKALAAAAPPESAQALQAYVDHAGPPIVELALTCEGTPKLHAHARDGLHVPVCVRVDPKTPTKTCTLVGESTDIPITTCPTTVVATGGGYYNVVWTTHGARGPLPKWSQLTAADKIALGADLGAATSRGDLAPAAALSELTELAANKDTYAQYAAVSIAQALDPLVADAERERWSTWLAARFTLGDARGVLGDKVRGALLDMISPAQMPVTLRTRAKAAVARTLAKNAAPWDAGAVLAADPDHATFEKLAELARDPKGDLDQREAAMVDLSAFGPSEIPNAVAELAALLPAREAWNAVGPYFDRAATRNAAWAAVREHVAELFAKMTSPQARELIDATGALCDPAARAEVVAAIEPHLGAVREGKPRLAHALASIDRCIARRAKAGDFAAALP